MGTIKEFFQEIFQTGEGYVMIAEDHPSNVRYIPLQNESWLDELEELSYKQGDVYFGPSIHKTQDATKESILGSKVLWVDVDEKKLPRTTFPPSITVWSGHGWHLYWVLRELERDSSTVETFNKSLFRDTSGSDKGVWNSNRLLRIPGTLNTSAPQARVELRFLEKHIYRTEDINVLKSLDAKTRHKIRSGDRRGYSSRSERDWAVVLELIRSDATDDIIHFLFKNQPVGDKYNDPETSADYLQHTIDKARERAKDLPTQGSTFGFVERADGYYVVSKANRRRVSTFTLEPELLLDGSPMGSEDAIVATVSADEFSWPRVTFSRSAFTRVNKFDKEAPVAAWQWLGNDGDLRQLLPHLLDQLKAKGFPRVLATPVLGLHEVEDKGYFFVGTSQTISAEEIFEDYTGPIAWLPSKKEHPELNLLLPSSSTISSRKEYMAKTLYNLNEPEVILPMLGWYGASMLKPWLETSGYRFPVLHVTGTRGSGKTTLIQRVFSPLLGQTEVKGYDAGTTRFVILALLGSSNAVPISFSEFRYSQVEKFLRYVLLAYDTGHDPRGRADQTTVDYPLSAPFSLDGEDLLVDPAAQQRIIVARLGPGEQTIPEGSIAYETYKDYQERNERLKTAQSRHSNSETIFSGLAGAYIQGLLRQIETGDLNRKLSDCRRDIFRTFEGKLPDRVRNNLITVFFGATLFAEFLEIDAPNPMSLARSLSSVFNLKAGRARTLADDFVEDVINQCANSTVRFRWAPGKAKDTKDGKLINTVWIQIGTAHNWWLAVRRGRGRGALERDAIITQLKEAEYFIQTKVKNNTWMYEVDMQKAQDAGLDVPNRLGKKTLTITH